MTTTQSGESVTHTHTHTHTQTQVMEQLHAELGMAHVQRQAQEEVEQHKLKLLRAQEDMSKWCVCERESVCMVVYLCVRESLWGTILQYWITGVQGVIPVGPMCVCPLNSINSMCRQRLVVIKGWVESIESVEQTYMCTGSR